MSRFRPDYAAFAVLVAVTAWLLLSGCAVSGPEDPRARLAGELSIIEGYLAAPPVLERGGRRLILYLGDPAPMPEPEPSVALEDAVTGEVVHRTSPADPVPPGALVNIRKAATENREEKDILRALGDKEGLLTGWKTGAEGPRIRLYGKHVEEDWNEYVQGVDFAFCYLEYRNEHTGRDDVVDTCYGDRWHDELLRMMREKSGGALGAAKKVVVP
ncbi:MAG: hypothetical protein GY778_28780 [bacterium]|nr:hypothetical protein [bacterium]